MGERDDTETRGLLNSKSRWSGSDSKTGGREVAVSAGH